MFAFNLSTWSKVFCCNARQKICVTQRKTFRFILRPRSPRSKVRKASAWIACNKLNEKSEDLKTAVRNKDQTVSINCGVFRTLWKWNVDPDQEAGGKCQWMLHQNAANGPECALAITYKQPGTIREPPKWRVSEKCGKIKNSWPLCLSQWRDCFKSAALRTST